MTDDVEVEPEPESWCGCFWPDVRLIPSTVRYAEDGTGFGIEVCDECRSRRVVEL